MCEDIKSPAATVALTTSAASTADGMAAPAEARHLSAELDRLIRAFDERSVQLREVIEVTHGRGYTVVLFLLTFPFCTPLPLPGVSAPFGLVVAIIGFRLALGQKPWLPERLLNKTLPAKFFPRVLAATRWLVIWLERLVKPRLGHVLRWRVVDHLIGIMIFGCGLFMMLPFPIPFSNGLPALAVLLLAAAMFEEDGYAAVAGGVVFLLTLAYFAAIFWGGTEVVGLIKSIFGMFLKPNDPQAQ